MDNSLDNLDELIATRSVKPSIIENFFISRCKQQHWKKQLL